MEKEEDKEEGEALSDREKAKQKEKDEGKEVESNRTAEAEEVGIKTTAPLQLKHICDVQIIIKFILFF